MNIGVLFPIHEDWDVSFELVDIAQQMSLFKNYTQRFGFGMEYRLHFFNNNLHVAPRIGLSNSEPSLGFGVSYRDIVMLNGAYYASALVQARRNFALQLTAWW